MRFNIHLHGLFNRGFTILVGFATDFFFRESHRHQLRHLFHFMLFLLFFKMFAERFIAAIHCTIVFRNIRHLHHISHTIGIRQITRDHCGAIKLASSTIPSLSCIVVAVEVSTFRGTIGLPVASCFFDGEIGIIKSVT